MAQQTNCSKVILGGTTVLGLGMLPRAEVLLSIDYGGFVINKFIFLLYRIPMKAKPNL